MKKRIFTMILGILCSTMAWCADRDTTAKTVVVVEKLQLKGDVNGDGKVDVIDVTTLIDIILGNHHKIVDSSMLEMITRTFEVSYVPYWSEDDSLKSMGTITIERDTLEENGLLIKGLFFENAVMKGSYDFSVGKIYIPNNQILGKYTNEIGTTYGFVFATVDASDTAQFTIHADGTLTADGMWGIYAMDWNFEEDLDWYEVAKVSTLIPLKFSRCYAPAGR